MMVALASVVDGVDESVVVASATLHMCGVGQCA